MDAGMKYTEEVDMIVAGYSKITHLAYPGSLVPLCGQKAPSGYWKRDRERETPKTISDILTKYRGDKICKRCDAKLLEIIGGDDFLDMILQRLRLLDKMVSDASSSASSASSSAASALYVANLHR